MLELKVTLEETFGDVSNVLAYGRGGGIFGLNPIPKRLLGGGFWEDCTDIGLMVGKLGWLNLGKLILGVWLLVLGKERFVCGFQNGGERKGLFGTTGLRRGGGGEFIDDGWKWLAGNDCPQIDELGL